MKTQVFYTLTTAATVALFPTVAPKNVDSAQDDMVKAKAEGQAFPDLGRNIDSDSRDRLDFAWESGASVMQSEGASTGESGFSTQKSSTKKNDPLAWEVVDGKKSTDTGATASIAELAQATPVTGAASQDANKGAADQGGADKKAPAATDAGAGKAGAEKKPGSVDLLQKKPGSSSSISDLVGGDKKPAGTTTGTTPADPMEPMEAIEGGEEGFFIRGAQLNDVFQFLATSAELNYFHNAELTNPSYVVTGQLQVGDPLAQMQELGLMYGITIHQKGNTVYAMTEGQLAQLPVKPFQYQLKYLRPSDIEQIKTLLTPILTPGRGSLDYESKTNTLIVIDNEQKVEALQGVLNELDQPKRQVAIEMRILRVNSGSRNMIGVDWESVLGEDGLALGADSALNNLFNLPDTDSAVDVITLNRDTFDSAASGTGAVSLIDGFADFAGTGSVTASTVGSSLIPSSSSDFTAAGVPLEGNGASASVGNYDASTFDGRQRTRTFTRTINSTGTGLVLDDVALDAVMRALNQGNLAEQESSPTLITEDNEQGIISIIDRVPIIVATVNQTSAGSNITEEVRYRIDVDDPVDDPANTREVGVTMSITPTILPDNTIRMVMRPRSAQIVEFIAGQTGNQYPRVNESTVDTIARVPDGSSLLIGGFYERANRDQENKVPIMGDIPWVNFFFKSTDKEKAITSLVFVVTPSAYDAESPKKTMEITKRLHDRQVLPFDHNWPDRKNPGFNHEAHLGNTLGNALKLYPEVPEWNPLMAEHPINEERTTEAESQQPPASHRQPENPLTRIFGFGRN